METDIASGTQYSNQWELLSDPPKINKSN